MFITAARVGTTVALTLLALTAGDAATARADRAYGAFEPFTDLVTFRTTDAGDRVTAFAARVQVPCGDDFFEWYTGSHRVVDALPAAPRRNVPYLVRRPGPAGTLAGDIVAEYGWSDGPKRKYTGRFEISNQTARSADVVIEVSAQYTTGDPIPCSGQVVLRGVRDPGRLYTGATSDGEPVWIERQLGRTVAPVLGFGTFCVDRFLEGIFGEALPIRRGRFGAPRLTGRYSIDGVPVRVRLSGRLSADRGTGTFRLVRRGLRAQACDTRTVRFTVSSG